MPWSFVVAAIRVDYVDMTALAYWIVFLIAQDTDRTWTLRRPLRSWRRRAERARAQVVRRRRRRLLLSSLPLLLEPCNTGSTTRNPTCPPAYRPTFLNLNVLLMRKSSLLSSTVLNQRYASSWTNGRSFPSQVADSLLGVCSSHAIVGYLSASLRPTMPSKRPSRALSTLLAPA